MLQINMFRVSLRPIVSIFTCWLWIIFSPAAWADLAKDLDIKNYGSFIYTERVPNALFFFSEIKQNDSFELRKALRNHNITTLVLSSAGGSVWESLNMAGIVHDKKLTTYVPEQGLDGKGNCASACAFLFFGGDTRIANGKLGVHQFYSGDASKDAKIGDTQENAQFTVSEIIGFLNEFETPPFVYERMFQQTEMYYFSENELEKVKRENAPLSENNLENIALFIEDINFKLAEIELQKSIQENTSTEKTTKVEVEPPAETVREKKTDITLGPDQVIWEFVSTCSEGKRVHRFDGVIRDGIHYLETPSPPKYKRSNSVRLTPKRRTEQLISFYPMGASDDDLPVSFTITFADNSHFSGTPMYVYNKYKCTGIHGKPLMDWATRVLEVQRELNRLNCNAGPTDGILGPKTISAAQNFIKSNKIDYQVNKNNIVTDYFQSLLDDPANKYCSNISDTFPYNLAGTYNGKNLCSEGETDLELELTLSGVDLYQGKMTAKDLPYSFKVGVQRNSEKEFTYILDRSDGERFTGSGLSQITYGGVVLLKGDRMQDGCMWKFHKTAAGQIASAKFQFQGNWRIPKIKGCTSAPLDIWFWKYNNGGFGSLHHQRIFTWEDSKDSIIISGNIPCDTIGREIVIYKKAIEKRCAVHYLSGVQQGFSLAGSEVIMRLEGGC